MTAILSSRDQELVALGTALGSNCAPCIEYHLPLARNAGISDVELAEVFRLADKIRQVPARKALDTANALLAQGVPAKAGCSAPVVADAGAGCCAPSKGAASAGCCG
ncbi:MAG: carboxymuconolactone decarboxylase family protein [Planctomycetes bacterium]|nr:carboxymuconolactone decarboxylase family protein [Planctomycetota bacterium]